MGRQDPPQHGADTPIEALPLWRAALHRWDLERAAEPIEFDPDELCRRDAEAVQWASSHGYSAEIPVA